MNSTLARLFRFRHAPVTESASSVPVDAVTWDDFAGAASTLTGEDRKKLTPEMAWTDFGADELDQLSTGLLAGKYALKRIHGYNQVYGSPRPYMKQKRLGEALAVLNKSIKYVKVKQES